MSSRHDPARKSGGAGRWSVWPTAQAMPRTQRAGRYLPQTVHHPARMLPALAAHAIATYTRPGDLVLDPMCGAGTTLVEAVHQGRRAVGVDYEPRWVTLATANLEHARAHGATGAAQVNGGDARLLDQLLPADMHGRVRLVLTSPPYGPAVHGQVTPGKDGVRKEHDQYSPDRQPGDRGNLAHQTPDTMLQSFAEILAAVRPFLAPDGHVVLTVRPWRQRGQLVDLPAQVLDAAHTAGLHCVERCVALLAGMRGDRLVARPSFFQLLSIRQARARGIPLHLIAHEDVLVLAARPRSDGSAEPQRPRRGRAR
ncbi:MAG TPA: DNA methyltransferase [Actinocatenispora sp.]